MKTRVIAASAIAALLILGVGAVAFARSGITLVGHNEKDNQNTGNAGHEDDEDNFNLQLNQVLHLGPLFGHYNNLTHGGDDPDDGGHRAGNSSGGFVFKVTGVSEEGSNLSITSGWFTIGAHNYTLINGTITLNEGNESGSGKGFAHGSGAFPFTIHIGGLHGNLTTGALVGDIKINVTIGKSSYHVNLGSHEGDEAVEESD